jgi:alpha-galactosidase
MRDSLLANKNIEHTRSHEYASHIMEAIETGNPFKIGGNVMNTGLITNLPKEACVEVPCLVDRSGINPTYIGDLPPQLAALNRTNINTQLLTIEAALTGKKEHIYHAAMLDPHTSAELSMDDIVALCDDLIEAHGGWLPEYK